MSKKYPFDKYQILLIGDATEFDLKDLRSKYSKQKK